MSVIFVFFLDNLLLFNKYVIPRTIYPTCAPDTARRWARLLALKLSIISSDTSARSPN